MLFSIEGNIGSGKSVLSKILKNHNNDLNILSEPVDTWLKFKNETSQNILECFYENKTKFAFQFNVLIYATKLNQLINNNNNNLTIIERSYISDFYVFAKMLYNQNILSKLEFDIYESLIINIKQKYPINIIFYLRTNPNVCYERYKKRNRNGEVLDINYLNELHNYHDHYFLNKPNVIVIDGNDDFENDLEAQQKIINKFRFIINNI